MSIPSTTLVERAATRDCAAAAAQAARPANVSGRATPTTLLVEVADSAKTMAAGRAAGVVWRDRSKDVPHHIRITVGTAEENNATLEVLSRV
jgi:histidinol-phosphate/aromatic aminotransferase/cobyric acid decarboxylase-like protein